MRQLTKEEHSQAKECFLTCLRYKKDNEVDERTREEINSYMEDLKTLIMEYESRTFKGE